MPPDSVLRLAGILKKLDRKVLVIFSKDGGHLTNYDDGKAIFDYVIRQVAETEAKTTVEE